MSKGFLLIAHDTEEIPYGRLSCLAAKLIKKHFNLPVTVITDKFTKLDTELFDKIILNEIGSDNYRFDTVSNKKIKWRNTDRSDAYILTPYEQTILLDSDYLIQSNNLQLLFNQNVNFLCHNTMLDATGTDQFQNNTKLGSSKLTFSWATVIYFRKSEYAKSIFSMWKHVKDNYEYYTRLHNLNGTIFRNDFALSIAIHMINGQVINNKFIPWPLINIPLQSVVGGISDGSLVYSYKSYNPNTGHSNQNVHLLPKINLHFFNKTNYEKIADELTR